MIWQNISAMSAPESADAPVNRPSMKKWVVLLVVLGALIGLGTMVKAWMDKRSGAAAQPVVFSGGSEHWDQNEVPISMQCGACHEKEFRQWAGSDHAWAFRKLGDQWESEAFHNMKLMAAFSNSLRMVTGAWSMTVSLQPPGARNGPQGEFPWCSIWFLPRTAVFIP